MVESPNQRSLVLLLGGSSFMGLTLLKQLTKLSDRYQVSLVNRGKTYWDGESKKIVRGNANVVHCKADRKSEAFVQIVSEHLLSQDLPLEHVIDFSCYKEDHCLQSIQVIDRVKTARPLLKPINYIFISTDSTYDASAFILDSHKHKHVPGAFLPQETLLNKPKVPKGNQRLMYEQTYGDVILNAGGITEPHAYSERFLKGLAPNYASQITPQMLASMRQFLKPLDSYGYKKILCEELFTQHATLNPDTARFVALRLADVIGPYDESFRFWKYVTWIKSLLAQPTRLDMDLGAKLRAQKIKYEVQKDSKRKLSMTFSVDVVKFILAHMAKNVNELPPFTAVNLACEEKLSLVELISSVEKEVRNVCQLPQVEGPSPLLEPIQRNDLESSSGGSSSQSSDSNSDGYAERAIKFYPSVDCGPISVHKLKSEFAFMPTPLADAIRSSVDFCHHCDTQTQAYEAEAREMTEELAAEFD